MYVCIHAWGGSGRSVGLCVYVTACGVLIQGICMWNVGDSISADLDSHKLLLQ